MTYDGSLQLAATRPTEDERYNMEHPPPEYDSRPRGDDGALSEEVEYPVIYLPHSCDEWVIGGLEEAKKLLEDLTIAIAILEQHDTGRSGQDRSVLEAQSSPKAKAGTGAVPSQRSISLRF